MWNILVTVLLFILCASGVFIYIPGPYYVRVLVRSVVFALIYNYMNTEHFVNSIPHVNTTNPSTKGDVPCPKNAVKCPSGDCELIGQIYGRC